MVLTRSEHKKLHQKEDCEHSPKKVKEPKILKGKNVKCEKCGKEFYTTDINRKCCSVKCSNELRNRGSSIIQCDNCNKIFKTKNSIINKSKNHFCCQKCYWEWEYGNTDNER